MIELHQFALVDGVNMSPFCAKVEIYLRLRRLPYRVVADPPFKGPNGKLPFVVVDGRTIADSGVILDHLETIGPDPLDAGLDAAARARGHLVRRTLEESLYFAMLWDRWADDAHWPRVRDGFFAAIPAPIRRPITTLVRRKILRDLKGQGTGRMSPAEIHARGVADIAAVSAALGDRAFLVADRPTTFDVTLHAFVDNLLTSGFPGPLAEATRACRPLVAHHGRMAAAIGGA